MSCESLEADGTVEANYKEDIIACVEKHGPYIVVMPNVANAAFSGGYSRSQQDRNRIHEAREAGQLR